MLSVMFSRMLYYTSPPTSWDAHSFFVNLLWDIVTRVRLSDVLRGEGLCGNDDWERPSREEMLDAGPARPQIIRGKIKAVVESLLVEQQMLGGLSDARRHRFARATTMAGGRRRRKRSFKDARRHAGVPLLS